MDQYSPQTRKKVEADIDAELANLSDDRKELLRRIFESMHTPDLNDTARLQDTIAKFATLLVSLSVQADKIQRWMVGLTICIAVMTFVLLCLTLLMFQKMP